MRLILPIGTIISQASKEKYGLVVARQAAFTLKIGTGTSWEFSQKLLLDHLEKNMVATLREILMNIKSTKFPGHPVFHVIDPAWGSDNGVNFNFHPDNKLGTRMYIAGLIPYIRDTRGEEYLNAFSAEAIECHMDSVFDIETKQIFSNTDIWVHTSLALDNECNFTEHLLILLLPIQQTTTQLKSPLSSRI
jgi:hypothetical protein